MGVAKILTKQQIEKALNAGKTHKNASRILNVNYATYIKYCKLYTNEAGESLWYSNRNRGAKGIPRYLNNRGVLKDVNLILDGTMVDVERHSIEKFKEVLVRNAIMEEKCCSCGFNEARIFDYKVPLLINFKNKNKSDWTRDNIEFLCYNCYFLQIGNIFNNKQLRDIQENVTSNKPNQVDWEIDDTMKEHLKSLGLWEDEKGDDNYVVYNN